MGKIRTKVVETAIEPERAKQIEEASKEVAEAAPLDKTAPTSKKKKVQKVRSKRYAAFVKQIDRSKEYALEEALKLIKEAANTKFESSIEAHINLNTIADKAEHQIRTLVTLPHQVAKKVKMLVFASKNLAEIKKLGAAVGNEDTLKEIESGKIDAAKIIADPSWMPRLAKVAKVLGPKGLMPSPKSGTVSEDPVKTVQEFSGGKLEIRTEKFPIIHTLIGKANFTEKQLTENFSALIAAINEARPEGLKKGLIKSIFVSTTMGPSVKVSQKPESAAKES